MIRAARGPGVGEVAAFVAAAFLVAGCGVDPSADEPAVAADGAGVEVAGPLTPVRWVVPPDPGGKPPLAVPVRLELDSGTGRLLVLELQPPAVRVYGLDGTYVRTVGREGDGPGEYRQPIGLAVGDSGLTAVLSMGGRVTFWSRAGDPVGAVRVGGGLATDVMSASGDTFRVKVDRFPPDDVSEVWVVTPAGPGESPMYRDDGLAGIDAPDGSRSHAYPIATAPDGTLIIGLPGPEYRLLRATSAGRVGRPLARPDVGPLRRSEREIEAIRERVRRGFAALGRAPPPAPRVPPYRPHVLRLAVAGDGTVWALTGRGDEGSSVIDAFGVDGTYLGTVRVPVSAVDLAVGADEIYLVAFDSIGLPGIAAVRRLGRSPSGAGR